MYKTSTYIFINYNKTCCNKTAAVNCTKYVILTSATLLNLTALGAASSLSVVSPARTGINVESP